MEKREYRGKGGEGVVVGRNRGKGRVGEVQMWRMDDRKVDGKVLFIFER